MATTFTYSFTANGQSDVVVVTVDTPATNSTAYGLGYNVTAISGTIGGNAISGEVGTGGSVQYTGNSGGFDNTIFASSVSGAQGSYYGIDGLGIEFTVGSTSYNLYSTGASSLHLYSPSARTTANVTLTSTNAPCYCSGTLILTDQGECPVEALAIGNLVLTASGALRPVKWLGHRVVDCTRHPDPAAVMPVRIDAGAFGPGLPERDLWVSPGHAVCAPGEAGVLIPAHALCNGATVQQVEVEHITYWHVELDSHDILLANALPAESYMDVGNRRFFAEADATDLHAVPDAAPGSLADYCRPFVEAGPLVEAVRDHLRARAVALGWVQAAAPLGGAHLLVAGSQVDPVVDGTSLRFALPRDTGPVWLVSDAVSPHDVAASNDLRQLGMDIRAIGIEGAGDMALDDPLLCAGWHGLEDAGGTPHRWTSGRALLPAALWQGCPGALTLRIDLAGPSVAGWHAPELDPMGQARAA